jgi:O-antigen/teichoic acid export membrane protein
MKDKITEGFFSILFSNVGRLFLALIITPIMVRLLGSAKYGDYAFLLGIISLWGRVVYGGLNDGIRKYVAEGRDGENWKEQVLAFYIHIGTILIGLTTVVILVTVHGGYLTGFLGSRIVSFFPLIGLVVLSRACYTVARSALMGVNLERISEPIRVIQRLFFGITGILLVYYGFGVTGVLVGHMVGSLMAALAAFYFVKEYYDIREIVRIPGTTFPRKELISFNVYSTFLLLLGLSLYNVDVLLLQPMAGSQPTGYYKAALTVAHFLWFVPMVLQTVLLHSTSDLWSQNDQSVIDTIASKITRYTVLFTLLIALGIGALAQPFLTSYFGQEFTASVIPLLLLIPGTVSFAVARPIYSIGQASGNLTPLMLSTGIGAGLNLGLNLFLIPRYGMNGAAVATSISYGSMLILHSLASRKIGFNPFADLRLPSIVITTIASAPIIFGISYVLQSGILSLIVVPPVGLTVYGTIAVRAQAITADEIESLLQPIPIGRIEPVLMLIRRIEG